jgi:hypothetical protein
MPPGQHAVDDVQAQGNIIEDRSIKIPYDLFDHVVCSPDRQ